eukprot:CAMPEP_0197641934 /NCGR_PEP_ID=MMETSP1338-20131121/15738_1 /TAXON_ID=43686 ORGANISM="Pelagodinium beii, Strain RCC1491" /NCGR_SAMPLE_ID=MMETSP1338 /ASSEMBLY_ACC=CAM_ASM_000754 /LENGTH=358 /DNA_ID=CAMNT_0043214985 /DNA_START=47 /DNA_END=1123 /DNA_ORIENTATION=+
MPTFAEKAFLKTCSLPASGKTIGTHSGSFQADEALGCWLLRQLPAFADAAIVRSRDAAVLEPCDIVIDVGGVYDHEKLLYDHHQRGFFETADGKPGAATKPTEATGRWKTKLSASGLVYKHYGREIISQLSGTGAADTEALWSELYDQFMEGIDAIDNGIEISDGARRYKESSDLSSRVHRLNPRWNEKSDHADQCARFEKASQLCGAEFLDVLAELVESWLPARSLVQAALEKRSQTHTSGEILKLESGGMPWKDNLYSLEREAGTAGLVKFVLYVDQAGMWRVQAVTVEGTLFENRVSLMEPWRGLRDAELSKISGIADCCFVHANGFIGGNKTFEGALEMALKSIQAASKSGGYK